jgi:hypothetical protein
VGFLVSYLGALLISPTRSLSLEIKDSIDALAYSFESYQIGKDHILVCGY